VSEQISALFGSESPLCTAKIPEKLPSATVPVAAALAAPGGSDQNQAKVPLRQEQEALGHAVTAAYLWVWCRRGVRRTGRSV
jgi:hypothetical protein